MNFRNGEKQNKAGQKSGSRGNPRGTEASFLGRYYTAIENLILFLFSRSTYLTALRSMVRDEVEYRVGLIMQSLVLLTLSLFFLFSAMAYLSAMALLSIQLYTGNWIVSAGILFVLSLAFFLILILVSRDLLRRLTEKRPDEKARPSK